MMQAKFFVFRENLVSVGDVIEDPRTGKYYRIVKFIGRSWDHQDDVPTFVYQGVHDEKAMRIQREQEEIERRAFDFGTLWLEIVEGKERCEDIVFDEDDFELYMEHPSRRQRIYRHKQKPDVWALQSVSSAFGVTTTVYCGEKPKTDEPPSPLDTFHMLFG